MSNFQIHREGYKGTVTPSDSTLLKLAVVVSPFAFSCSCQKIGSVLYHSGGDLIFSLSCTLKLTASQQRPRKQNH